MEHGQRMEDTARSAFEAKIGKTVRECGLFIDFNSPYLAASPDGIIEEEQEEESATVEIKCTSTGRDTDSLEEAVEKGFIDYVKKNEETGEWEMTRTHDYFYQVQGQMTIAKKGKCYFVMHAIKWQHYIVVHRDNDFWKEKMEKKLERFYMQALLPEIVHPFRGQVQFFKKIDHTYIREAEYVIKAKQARQAAEEAKALKKSANEEKECREKDIEKNENNGKGKGIDKENDKDINKDVGRKRGRKPKGNVEIRENLENAQKKKGRPRKNNKENIPRIDTENDKEIKIVGKKRRRKPKENVENKENFENNKENGQKKNGRKRRSNQENIPAVLEKRSKQHFR